MALSCIEVSLAWLISKSTHWHAHRRLNEIENQLANLARLHRPIDVRNEVRMNAATVEQLVGWVTEHEPPFGELIHRLEVYLEPGILITHGREGWISLYLV